jgi:hypothetical protein
MVKIFLLSVLSLAFTANTLASDSDPWQGTWVLDSIQLVETTAQTVETTAQTVETSADSVIRKTLLPGERYTFDWFWIGSFTLDEATETVSYTLTTGRSFSGMQYKLTPNEEDSSLFTLFISGAPAVKYCTATLQLDDGTLQLEETFETYVKNQHINAVWRFYYHKL